MAKNKQAYPTSKFEHFGMAALMPGMQYMLDQMQNTLDQFRQAIQVAQGDLVSPPPPPHLGVVTSPRKLGRPPGQKPVDGRTATNPSNIKAYWAKLTPEQRSAEVRRRMKMGGRLAVATKSPEAKAALSPQQAYWARMSPRQRKNEMKRRGMSGAGAWVGVSPAEKKKRIAKMMAARAANAASRQQAVNGAVHV